MRTDDNMPRDDEVDAGLRDAYRRMATETTPPHLDKAVLDAAAGAGSPAASKGLWLWRRPIAWVTMIGLSFAIVLELSQTGTDIVPTVEESLPQASPAALAESPAPVAADALRRESADDAGVAARQALENSVAAKTEAEKRRRDEELETMSAPYAAELAESDAQMAEPAPAAAADAAALGLTASGAAERMQADSDQPADLFILQGNNGEPACDEATRADVERWRDCIATLVKARRVEEARVEIGLFRKSHPDEPSPIPVK